MRISSLIGFIGVLLSAPLLAETLIIEGAATDMRIYDIRVISIFVVYLPILLSLIASLFAKWLHTASGVLLFTSGLIILIPGIAFGLITEQLFFGISGGILFLIAGGLLLFNVEK
jgi:hypothetical protein